MTISALLTMAFLVTAIIVFACGIIFSNGIYRSHTGFYGKHKSDGFFGSMPDDPFGKSNGNSTTNNHRFGALIAGLPLACFSFNNGKNGEFGDPNNVNLLTTTNCQQINGTIGFRWGMHAAWYFAIVAFALIPLALFLGLLIKTKGTVVQTQRVVERRVTTQPAVVPASYVPPQGLVGNQTV
jgi:hypothetical protein